MSEIHESLSHEELIDKLQETDVQQRSLAASIMFGEQLDQVQTNIDELTDRHKQLHDLLPFIPDDVTQIESFDGTQRTANLRDILNQQVKPMASEIDTNTLTEEYCTEKEEYDRVVADQNDMVNKIRNQLKLLTNLHEECNSLDNDVEINDLFNQVVKAAKEQLHK